MKNPILTVIFILTFSFAFSQDLDMAYPVKALEAVEFIVTYNLAFRPDSLNLAEVREEHMLLFVGRNQSRFLSKNNYLAIQQFKKMQSSADLQAAFTTRELAPPITRFRFEIFKNYPENKITTLDYVLPDNFLYRLRLPLFNWSIGKETSTLKGFQVQKATTDFGGRSWIVWFAPEIPYSDGPYKFNGLPGLILKAYDTRKHYVFELVSLKEPEVKQVIEFPIMRNYIEATVNEFLMAREAFRRDIISRAADAGLSSHSQQVAAQNMRRRNNPIVLSAE